MISEGLIKLELLEKTGFRKFMPLILPFCQHALVSICQHFVLYKKRWFCTYIFYGTKLINLKISIIFSLSLMRNFDQSWVRVNQVLFVDRFALVNLPDFFSSVFSHPSLSSCLLPSFLVKIYLKCLLYYHFWTFYISDWLSAKFGCRIFIRNSYRIEHYIIGS